MTKKNLIGVESRIIAVRLTPLRFFSSRSYS